MALATLTLALLASHVAGIALRDANPPKPKAIKEKWDKMDDFLEVMFTMACTAKHGKDVNGLAAEKLKQGKVEGAAGYAAHVQKTQAGNLEGLEQSCGFIVGDGKKKCREGCATRWNGNAGARSGCDGKCVTVYANFEKSCMKKAVDLEKVYQQKNSKAAAQKQCYEGHCKEFPQVWMMGKAKAKRAEVETQCSSRCAGKNVKSGCQKKAVAGQKLVAASVASKCAAKTGVTKCFKAKKSSVDASYKKCKTSTKAQCGKAFAVCSKKGNTKKSGKDAKAFCVDRKKMCLKQSDKKCLDDNKAGLDSAESKCKKSASKAFKSCKDTTLKKRMSSRMARCMKRSIPKCKKSCLGKCQVGKMNDCLLMLKQKGDPAKMFCKDFWHLLHTSSEVDPVTGNPIVLLSQKSSLSPVL